jgi:A/G-specific adenine glycosylase
MLQQTRVETVVPYYRHFLGRFPTVEALAKAPLEDVLSAWSGLGYYRRARHLHHAAASIVREHGGRFPENPVSIRSLPGVGRYTEGAIRSIAFGQRAPLVDGNVARVLCRLFALRGDPRRRPLSEKLWSIAAALVPLREPGAFNQALMELGARVCTPRAPRCSVCPLRRRCDARARGNPERYPTVARRSRARRVEWAAAVVRRGPRVLLVRRPQRGLLGGMWDLPTVEVVGDPLRSIRRGLRPLLGAGLRAGKPLGVVRHGIEDLSIRIHVIPVRAARFPLKDGFVRWCPLPEALLLPLTGASRKALAMAGLGSGSR